MQLFRTLDELAPHARNVCLAIGVFDGVHLGHQRVINQARTDAKACDGLSVVLTFDPHPMRVLRPDQAPLLLTSTVHKLALIDRLEVDACLLVTFDKSFSETPAETFVARVADRRNQLREICVGTRFRFGHDRAGDVRLLQQLAPRFGYDLKEIKSVLTSDGEMISSTAVRQHVLAGNLDRAAAMLGRPFSVLGSVEKGDRLGHRLGFPTANLDPHNEVLPPNGVYAARVLVHGERHGGVVNIGVRPTFEVRPHNRMLEVHIFEFQREIYGQDVEVEFVRKLRDERKFASAKELKAQISADVETARRALG
ncbi:MAG TPA: bifunctional riboflavin kinase/FAD synthetase [Verrucomicrobiae bacterium]|nr:bifunctional riboflavin kinase/FAD synthetase [Verrucomicrobiae bacterium]